MLCHAGYAFFLGPAVQYSLGIDTVFPTFSMTGTLMTDSYYISGLLFFWSVTIALQDQAMITILLYM